MLAKTMPRNGIKLRKPLAIPSATAPCIPIASKTATVTAAIAEPTTKFPPANPRVNVVLTHKHKNIKNGTTAAITIAPATEPTPLAK